MFETILVPVDGSRHARCAIEAAVELAKCHGSSILLLHVIRDLSLPKEIMEMIRAGEVTESRTEILRNSAEIILENAQVMFDQAGISDVKTEYVIGNPAAKIQAHAEAHHADLIVLGQRGLGPTEGLLGGVARKLLNTTTISCLVITEPVDER
ncbi:MAG: universal stress protein [Anaerolineae bacterium]|jgi:nucleotide-binding universal stress UspA family protein